MAGAKMFDVSLHGATTLSKTTFIMTTLRIPKFSITLITTPLRVKLCSEECYIQANMLNVVVISVSVLNVMALQRLKQFQFEN